MNVLRPGMSTYAIPHPNNYANNLKISNKAESEWITTWLALRFYLRMKKLLQGRIIS